MIQVKLEGLEEVEKMFRSLGETGEKHFQKALTEMAIEGTSAMRLACPVKTNRLRSSTHWETPNVNQYSYTDKTGKGYNGKFDVKLGKLNAAFGTNVDYAEAVNDGTVPHIIRPVNAKALRFIIDGNVIYAKSVRHPGTTGRKFFEAGTQKAESVIVERLRINYEKAINEALSK
jgi:hypothetical protein